MPAADNYLELEAVLIDRWESQVSELKQIVALPDLNAELIKDSVKRFPAGVLIWNGADVPGGEGSSTDHGRSNIEFQRWLFLIAVKNVSDIKGGSGKRAEAGPLLMKTIRAFAGWKPSALKQLREAIRVSAPGATTLDNIAFYPVQFSFQKYIN